MRPGASTEARDALEGLSDREVRDLLGLLCSNRPEAVLEATAALRRHQSVVSQLLAAGPQEEPGPSQSSARK